jgi:hypothetical protein
MHVGRFRLITFAHSVSDASLHSACVETLYKVTIAVRRKFSGGGFFGEMGEVKLKTQGFDRKLLRIHSNCSHGDNEYDITTLLCMPLSILLLVTITSS